MPSAAKPGAKATVRLAALLGVGPVDRGLVRLPPGPERER
jgi:hypothetical protein